MAIHGTTQLLGVIGDPIHHSLSPAMHNAALAQLEADYIYMPLRVSPSQLPAAVQGLGALGCRGFNVTIPHKQQIIPLLQEVSAEAQAIGAVNTVWATAAGWAGTNTDVLGFLAPLRSLPRDWSQATVVVLGSGGAARAVVAGGCQLGCNAIQVVGRTPPKLQQFQRSWEVSQLHPPLSTHSWEQLSQLLPHADLVVNTTPVGMYPHSHQSPLSPEQVALLPDTAIAYDLIYTPRPTAFLAAALGHGLKTIDGSEMLVQQGAAALEIWLQQPVPVDTMRQALLSKLTPPDQG